MAKRMLLTRIIVITQTTDGAPPKSAKDFDSCVVVGSKDSPALAIFTTPDLANQFMNKFALPGFVAEFDNGDAVVNFLETMGKKWKRLAVDPISNKLDENSNITTAQEVIDAIKSNFRMN